jgi:hypothetical protein
MIPIFPNTKLKEPKTVVMTTAKMNMAMRISSKVKPRIGDRFSLGVHRWHRQSSSFMHVSGKIMSVLSNQLSRMGPFVLF